MGRTTTAEGSVHTDLPFQATNYDENQAQILAKYGSDEPARFLQGEIAKLQQSITDAGRGLINKRRAVIADEAHSRLVDIAAQYHRKRRDLAQRKREDLKQHLSKKPAKGSTESLAEVMQAQLRAAAMSDSEIANTVADWSGRRNAEKAHLGQSRAFVDALTVELRRRGDNDNADALREAMSSIPDAALGDYEAGLLLDEAEFYDQRLDTTTALMPANKDGGPVGVGIDQLVDLTPLEDVPA